MKRTISILLCLAMLLMSVGARADGLAPGVQPEINTESPENPQGKDGSLPYSRPAGRKAPVLWAGGPQKV